jgi:3-oxoacyl-(acyl-carrier-protein) synthase/acyl carrier protein
MRLNDRQIARLGEAHGTVPMPANEGLAALEAALGSARRETAILYGPSPVLPHDAASVHASGTQQTRRADRAAAATGPRSLEHIRAVIAGTVAEALALPVDRLDGGTHLADYGIDSIMLQSVARQLSARLGLEIDGLELHKHPTVERLTTALGARLAGAPRPAPVSSPPALVVKTTDDDLAIVGLDIRVSGASTLAAFERLLFAGEIPIAAYPETRWLALPGPLRAGRRRDSYRGVFLEDIDAFDARLFGISPREAMLMDPQHRLALQAVWRAIEDAGYRLDEFATRKTSVFVAIGPDDYGALAQFDETMDEFRGRGTRRYMAAHRISHFFDLEGASETVDTACSSVFVALDRACAALRSGLSDQAIVAGAHLNLLPGSFEQLEKQGLLTARDGMHPLDREADGFIRAEGVGALILKPVSRARADRDHIYALVKGVGVWHAGKAMGLTAPSTSAHRQAMERALAQSHVSVNDLSYVEAHGTGMSLGDASEVEAFNEVFRTHGRTTPAPCVLSAVKSTIGHLETASGLAALMKAIVALRRGEVPGVAGLRAPRAGLDSGFWRVTDTVQPLPGDPARNAPPVVGLSSYGLGGVSAFVVLQQAPEAGGTPVQPRPAADERLFVLSAASPEVLQVYLGHVRAFLVDAVHRGESPDFEALIATYQAHRQAMPVRLAIVAGSVPELLREIDAALEGHASARVYRSGQHPATADSSTPRIVQPSEDWHAVASAWVSGRMIAWPVAEYGRQSFPAYPFDARSRFWIRWSDDDRGPIDGQSSDSLANHVGRSDLARNQTIRPQL